MSERREAGIPPSSEHADDFVAAGIYDPDAPNAASMLELLDWLVESEGASIPEIVAACEYGGLLSLAAFRTLAGRPRALHVPRGRRRGGSRLRLCRRKFGAAPAFPSPAGSNVVSDRRTSRCSACSAR